MAEQDLIPYLYRGEINTCRTVGFQDPEIVAREQRRKRILEWLDKMNQPETDEQHDEWQEPVNKLRPNLTEDLPPDDITGLERLVQSFWGHELMAMALVFVAGKQRFADIMPAELTPEFIQKHSLAANDALYVMTTSSLYWEQRENPLEKSQAQLKVKDIAWTFGISPQRSTEAPEGFDRAINYYHGHYQHYESAEYDGSDAIKLVRERLGNKPITVPLQIRRWIDKPLQLIADFGIESTIPRYAEYRQQPIDQYLRIRE